MTFTQTHFQHCYFDNIIQLVVFIICNNATDLYNAEKDGNRNMKTSYFISSNKRSNKVSINNSRKN